jgi:hypothetical protein
MSKFSGSSIELLVRNHSSVKEMTPARTRRRAQGAADDRMDELATIVGSVTKMREDLLDYNPVLAVMADALCKAVELELETQRCNQLVMRNRV